MKKRVFDILMISVLVAAMTVGMTACGAKGTKTAKAAAPSGDAAPENKAEGEKTEQTGEPRIYENKGLTLTVPAELADQLTVTTPEVSEDGVIFNVYETASVDAANALGNENLGFGWIFAITERDEASARRMIDSDAPGQEPIAMAEDGTYYVYNYPTDVRYERKTEEEREADMPKWEAVLSWADTVRISFAEENGLAAVSKK